MTILTEGEFSFFLTAPASLVDQTIDTASDWAKDIMVSNPAYRWIKANYAESDRANRNNQFWSLDELVASVNTVVHSPLNINHDQNKVVGHFAGAHLVYPDPEAATDQAYDLNPYIETLAVFYKHKNQDIYKKVEAAYNSGIGSVSMECVADTVTCIGDNGCGKTFTYKGAQHESYCRELNDRSSTKQFNGNHFVGGAVVLPPHGPGWTHAHITDLSVLEQVDEEYPELSDEEKENLAQTIIDQPSNIHLAQRIGKIVAQRIVNS